jgi:pimeloyl-ACP methyl ester carboxylesterase
MTIILKQLTIIIATILSLYSISFLIYGNSSTSAVNFTAYAQSDVQTIKYRDMVIDLGNGVETDAQLTYPAVGNGPFPGILLIPGSGAIDMNDTIDVVRIDNKTGAKIYPPVRPFFEIAQYLSERGFVVLRSDKRGIGENHTILDSNVWGNVTFDDLKQDAEKALDVLIQQPEVDANHVTLIGHSEGTIIAPRVAIDNPGKVDKIVLMAAAAQNFRDLVYYQTVTIPVLYAQQILDHDHNGLLSVQEASKNPIFSYLAGNFTLLLTQNITTANGTTTKQQLRPQYNLNNDTVISINDELKPRLTNLFKSLSVMTPGKKCTGPDALEGCPIWLASLYSSIPTLDILGKIPSDISILIQQGGNDTLAPIQQAFLLQQKLTELRHPDQTLITYPNLGHLFSPSSQWITGVGPIQDNVLQDLFTWLSDPVRDFKKLSILSSHMH